MEQEQERGGPPGNGQNPTGPHLNDYPERLPNAETAADAGQNRQENQTQATNSFTPSLMEHGFEGRTVRTLIIDDQLWFVAADVCRALNLKPHKGSFGGHVEKLDDDDRQQISREAVLAASPTPGLNPDAFVGGRPTPLPRPVGPLLRADDPLALDRSPLAWLVSESGLYTLILRSREATTPGTFAHRFRRWITKEVIPAIRRTGSYSALDRGASVTVTVSARLPSRYIVTVLPDQPPHVRRTELEAVIDAMDALDARVLCYTLKMIECWWQQTGEMRSIGTDPVGGLPFEELESTILKGSALPTGF